MVEQQMLANGKLDQVVDGLTALKDAMAPASSRSDRLHIRMAVTGIRPRWNDRGATTDERGTRVLKRGWIAETDSDLDGEPEVLDALVAADATAAASTCLTPASRRQSAAATR